MFGEQVLRNLERSANAGAWSYKVETAELWWSAGLRRLHGLPETAPLPPLDRMLERICAPAARARLRYLVDETLKRALAWDSEIEILGADGEPRMVRAPAEPVSDDAGHVIGLVGTFGDLEARKLGEMALREREQRFRAIFHSTFQMMALIRPDGSVIEINASAQREFGIDAGRSIGKPLIDVLLKAGYAKRDRLARFAQGLRRAAKGQFVRDRFACECR